MKMSEIDHKIFDVILQREGSFTFVAIPFSPQEVWGPRPGYQVTGTINDVAVRGTLGALRQDYFLRLGAAWMRDSGIEPGANVTVRLSLEGSPGKQSGSRHSKSTVRKPKSKGIFRRDATVL